MEEKSTNSNMDAVLKKLEELTSAAKENYIRIMYRDLPLKWELRDGILYLDGVRIAPAASVDMERMDEYIADATLDTIMIPVIDGTTDVIIFGGEYDFCIQFVDRYIKREGRYPEEWGISTESIMKSIGLDPGYGCQELLEKHIESIE